MKANIQDGFDFVGFAFVSKCQKISDQDFDWESLKNCGKNGENLKTNQLTKASTPQILQLFDKRWIRDASNKFSSKKQTFQERGLEGKGS